jgi:hypothetical protein
MVRLDLPDATPRDAIDDAAAALGLLLVNIVPKTDTFPAQVIYLTPDLTALVHLVDEGAGGALCYVVRGEGEGAETAEATWSAALGGRFPAPAPVEEAS